MRIIEFYLTSILNELVKLKRTFAFWLTIISALFIPVIYFIYHLFKYEQAIVPMGINPWEKFIGHHVFAAVPLLIPLFIVLLTSLILQIEHKSEGIKNMFTLPIPKWTIYFGKLTVVIIVLGLTYLLFYALILISGFILGTIHSELKLLSYTPNYLDFIKVLFRSFVAVLGIVALQFWLSFRFKNFIIPLGIGIVLVIIGLTVYQADEALFFPYAYNMKALPKKILDISWITEISSYSILFFILVSGLGFWNIYRMDIK